MFRPIFLLLLSPFYLLGSEVLVSVAPYRFMVQEIAGDTVSVQLMVPPGASSHTYEPTPKEIMKASKADIWFTIGEPFERRAVPSLKSFNAKLQQVDLKKGLDLIYDDHHHSCCHGEGGADLHFWLSPRLDKIQATTIAEALIARYPDNEELYRKNLETFLQRLDALNDEIAKITKNTKQRTIMVSHPAYAYFVRDYGFTQLPIEYSGKDPSARQLQRVIEEARRSGVSTIYVQPQYSNKGANLIAEQIGANIVSMDPYGENLFESLRHIADQFSKG